MPVLVTVTVKAGCSRYPPSAEGNEWRPAVLSESLYSGMNDVSVTVSEKTGSFPPVFLLKYAEAGVMAAGVGVRPTVSVNAGLSPPVMWKVMAYSPGASVSSYSRVKVNRLLPVRVYAVPAASSARTPPAGVSETPSSS